MAANSDYDLIRTYTKDELVEQIVLFLRSRNVQPNEHVVNQIFNLVYRSCCPPNMNVRPELVLYGETETKNILSRVSLR